MADISGFLAHVSLFRSLKQGEQVRLLGYYLQHWKSMPRFSASDIKDLYAAARYPTPSNVPAVLANERKAKRLLHDKNGYYLTVDSDTILETTHIGIAAVRQSAVKTAQNLRDLIPKLTSADGASYLDEAVKCFEAECYRAAIVMSWALCYDHVLAFILADRARVSDCNNFLSARKMKISAITSRDDFAELKESDVLEMCRITGVIGKTVSKTLKQCLDIRNDYAHPSGKQLSVPKAEAFIEDIVNNVIVRL